MKNVLLSSGEVSGDIIGASIANELRRRDPAVRIWGLGGVRMRAASVQICRATNHLGRVGVSESFSAIWPLLRAFHDVRRRVLRERPDVAVLIANDVFNAILGRWLRSIGVPTVAVFPPQVWIWRSLLPLFCRSYDAVAASFDDEARLYRAHVRTLFVGHPLADTLEWASEDVRRRSREALGVRGRVIGLLPGSRTHEIRVLAPILVRAATMLRERWRDLGFVMAVADPEQRATLSEIIQRSAPEAEIHLVDGSADVLRASELLLLASGTATLEASLIGTPMVVAYRVSPLTVAVVRAAIRLGLMDSETIALPNLLLRETVVPEVRQKDLTAERVACEASLLLEDPRALAAMRDGLARVRPVVAGGNAIARMVDLAGEAALRPVAAAAPEMAPVVVE